jgi:D-serine deaminase-like pyridoxal phosphate-dependent protein
LLGGHGLRALVEVDSGHHRSGVRPEAAGGLARQAVRTGLDVRGVFTFPGHSYAPGGLDQAAADEARSLTAAARSLREAGVEPQVLSGGSTPSLTASRTDALTELRPGVYVFGDAQQWELGSMTPEQIALVCRATVVSHAGDRLVLDAGSKALGADRAPYASGFGRLPAHPEARIVLLSEHHAVADLGSEPLPPIGSQVDVVPNHVCNAVNLADHLVVDDAGEVTAWPVVARSGGG